MTAGTNTIGNCVRTQSGHDGGHQDGDTRLTCFRGLRLRDTLDIMKGSLAGTYVDKMVSNRAGTQGGSDNWHQDRDTRWTL